MDQEKVQKAAPIFRQNLKRYRRMVRGDPPERGDDSEISDDNEGDHDESPPSDNDNDSDFHL